MKRVIIFGGAFNPPTKAHREAAQLALDETGYDELWFMPCKDHAIKSDLASAEHRVNMLNLIINDSEERMKVLTWEIINEGKYSVDTILQLKEAYPENEFALLIGVDNANSFTTWKDYKVILKNIRLFIIDRAGYNDFKADWLLSGDNIRITLGHAEAFETPISSTAVRNLVKARSDRHLPCRFTGLHLTTMPILDYIEVNGLYK